MKAMVNTKYGPPDVLELAEVERPTPKDDEVVLKVHAASVNPADWHLLRGEPYIARLQLGLREPKDRVLGCDVVGHVEAVGKDVATLRPGDEVFGSPFMHGFGAFAEYVCVPDDLLAPKPANLSFEQAAAVPLAASTALQGLRDHGRIAPEHKVLIVGASGGVGTFAVQIAKYFGAEVTGVCSTRNVELVRSLGADHVVDYTQEDFTDGGQRYDLIFQLAGTRSPSDCRRALTSKGTLVQISGDSDARLIGPMDRIIKALVLSPFVSQKMASFTVKPNKEDLRFLKQLIEDGKLTPVIDRTYSLSETPEAIRYLENGHARGKVVIRVPGARTHNKDAERKNGKGVRMDSNDVFTTETAGLAEASNPSVVRLRDGDHFDLRIHPVRKRIGDAEVRMLGYNGSIPGPTLHVDQGSEITVAATNDGDVEATVHWHGLRLENRYDGVPEETQVPIAGGETFTYKLQFPDPGFYWYHPHIREDFAQEMGLYAPIVVEPSDPSYWSPVDRQLTITLDDVLIENGQIAPFSRSGPNFVAMGRFGNVMLINGETEFSGEAKVGEVVRLYLVNTANTRIFNFAVRGARMKLVGGDSGRHEREMFVDEVLLAPSERMIVDVLFDTPGDAHLEHRTPDVTYDLGAFSVAGTATEGAAESFEVLRTDPELAAERRAIGHDFEREPDKTLSFVASMPLLYGEEVQASYYVCPMHAEVTSSEPGTCPKCGMRLVPAQTEAPVPSSYVCPMHPEVTAQEQGTCPKCGMKLIAARVETLAPASYACPMHPEVTDSGPSACPKCGMKLVPSDALPAITSDSHEGHVHGGHDHGDGLEWEDLMPEINRASDTTNMFWRLVDGENGAENHRISWKFTVGDKVKIRLVNEMDSDHPMHHPFHIHGAGRFLILSRDGRQEPNLVWKDTVLLRAGETVDILLYVTNPGLWMAHCHIAEHTESGMMFSFDVASSSEGPEIAHG